MFDELSGSLDHALATAALADKVTGLAHWNINSVESFAYQYVGDPALYAPNPYRSSDHDPLRARHRPARSAARACCRRSWAPTATTSSRGTDGVDVIMGLGGNDVITGGNGDGRHLRRRRQRHRHRWQR